MFSREATNINFLVFGLNRPGLEPTIYLTRGKHANHYATDVVYKEAGLRQVHCILFIPSPSGSMCLNICVFSSRASSKCCLILTCIQCSISGKLIRPSASVSTLSITRLHKFIKIIMLSWQEQVTFRWDDDNFWFVQDQLATP